jgi:diadenosine tetraphosphate (Ap4A) HIT family hydrolase
VETPLGVRLSYLRQDTGRQGFRVVADERVRKVLEKTGPLVTSSANLPGAEPSNTIEEAFNYFGDTVDFYVDGGNRAGQPPSTIAKITEGGIEIIRQGAVVIPAEYLAVASPSDCPLCLTNDNLKTSVLYQNDDAYLTTALGTTGSYLIIPKIHTEEFSDLPDDWWKHFKDALANLPQKFESYNITVNRGRNAGQSLNHLHFWIVRRSSGQPSSGKGLYGLIKALDERA